MIRVFAPAPAVGAIANPRSNPGEAPVETARFAASGVTLDKEMVALHHQISALRTNQTSGSILFIGSREAEGTSTIAREFARVSATVFGQRVLLLESQGITPDGSVPITEGTVVPVQVGNASLRVAPLPRALTAPSHTTNVHGVAALWERLREGHDLIVVDAPSVARSPDGLALAGQVDGVVLVVEANATRWPVAARTKESIVRSGGKVLGVVFNKRRHYIPVFLYDWL